MEKLQQFWKDLDGSAIFRKREIFLGGLLCLMTGLTVGMLVSPRKTISIGSNNINNSLPLPEEEAEITEE